MTIPVRRAILYALAALALSLGACTAHRPERVATTPLHDAIAQRADPASIRALLDAGANPDVRNRFGDTPLQLAAAGHGDAAVTRMLLAAGAHPRSAGASGDSP